MLFRRRLNNLPPKNRINLIEIMLFQEQWLSWSFCFGDAFLNKFIIASVFFFQFSKTQFVSFFILHNNMQMFFENIQNIFLNKIKKDFLIFELKKIYFEYFQKTFAYYCAE